MMGKRSFFQFCQQSKIADNNITSSVVDTHFKAANYEEFDQEGNDDNALVRFEFIEMLLRLSKAKYVDTGELSSISESLEKIFVAHIMPMEEKLIAYQKWRYEQLHTNEINDLLLINLNALRKLYDFIAKIKDYPRQKNLCEVYLGKLPTIDQVLKAFHWVMEYVDDRRILQAFHASKMFV